MKKFPQDRQIPLPSRGGAFEDMGAVDVPADRRIPANTVASRYRYALDKLRDAMRLEDET
jgi:hypothetical protein